MFTLHTETTPKQFRHVRSHFGVHGVLGGVTSLKHSEVSFLFLDSKHFYALRSHHIGVPRISKLIRSRKKKKKHHRGAYAHCLCCVSQCRIHQWIRSEKIFLKRKKNLQSAKKVLRNRQPNQVDKYI